MTGHRRNPPSQKALPFSEWSKTDREAWTAAQATAGVLYDGGVASHLKPYTRWDLTRRYAYFLSFLAHRGRLDPHGPAAASVTEENILDYVQYLQPRVSSVTLAQSLRKIARVASFLDPGRDWRWLQRLVRRLQFRAKPRDRRSDVVEIRELFRLGRQLMDRADKAETANAFSRALLYRDGLIIALLAADPLRLANGTGLEIGRTLIKDGATWSFNIPAEETKGGRLHLAILPYWSTPCIDRYIEDYRPLFRNADATNALWLSRNGRPLDDNSLYNLVCKRTYAALGKKINPHLFRSCLATSTAIHHGAHMGLAMTVLDHKSFEVTQRYYNQAKMIDAVQAYQQIVLADADD
jgi:site-specific recombinase XerD